MTWPRVLTERATLDRVLAGASIARFGDGELKLASGGATETHAANPALAAELRAILTDPAPGLLPAIPTMNPRDPSARSWARSRDRWARLLDHGRVYGSAFVGRAKNAPWIDTDEYRRSFRSLWRGRSTIAVCPAGHLLPRWLMNDGAEAISVVTCYPTEAYREVNDLEAAVTATTGVDLVVICAGPAAKPLANRIAARGTQAIDLGRGAGFLWKR